MHHGLWLCIFGLVVSSSRASPLLVYDLKYTLNISSAQEVYEEQAAIAAIAGLANRYSPNLYLQYLDADSFWLQYMMKPGGWLEDMAIENVTSGAGGVERLIQHLQSLAESRRADFENAAALYDPSVFPQSLLAATAAGVENLIPVAFRPEDPNSLYSRLITSSSGPKLRIGLNLTNVCNGSISGSIKLDCYTWATNRWLLEARSHNSPQADGSVHGYFIDYYWTAKAHTQPPGPNSDNVKSTVTNHDFVISRGGFFWDLSPWDDETPVDDPNQPLGSDVKALRMILDASNKQVEARRRRAELEASRLVGASTSGNRKHLLSTAPNATATDTFLHVSGFTPWYMKYVAPNGKHQGVATEWQTMLIATSYNTFVDADACCIGDMANAALFQHFPGPSPQERFQPPATPTPADLIAKGLLLNSSTKPFAAQAKGKTSEWGGAPAAARQQVSATTMELQTSYTVAPGTLLYFFYAGDFDSAAWLYSQFYPRWNDPARGSVPIAWPLDPALSVRFPLAFDLAFSDLTVGRGATGAFGSPGGNDTIITGDSGVGYISPPQLLQANRASQSGYPDGRDRWVDFSAPLYRRNGATYTGFLISGSAGAMTADAEEPYTRLAPHGMADQGYPSIHPHLAEGRAPVVPQSDISGDPAAAAKNALAPLLPSDPTAPPVFHMFRSVLTNPTYLAQVAGNVSQITGGRAVALSPVEQAFLQRVAEGAPEENCNYAAYLNDTLPASIERDTASLNVSLTLRNDGWNTLIPPSSKLRGTGASGYAVEVNASTVVADDEWGLRSSSCQSAGQRLTLTASVLPVCGVVVSTGLHGYAASTTVIPISVPIKPGAVGAVDGAVSVPAAAAAVALHAALGTTSTSAWIRVQYGVVALDASGAVVRRFSDRGVLPWVHDIHVV